MKIEDYKHLFVPVTERLPEASNYYYCLLSCGNTADGYYHNAIKRFTESSVIGWLDLSRLTTKDRAIDLATGAYYKGGNSPEILKEFIKNMGELL